MIEAEAGALAAGNDQHRDLASAPGRFRDGQLPGLRLRLMLGSGDGSNSLPPRHRSTLLALSIESAQLLEIERLQLREQVALFGIAQPLPPRQHMFLTELL
jgi:hypothetical protein